MPPTKTAAKPKATRAAAPPAAPPVMNTLFIPPVAPAPALEGVVPPAEWDLMNPPFPSHLAAAWELITPPVAQVELDRMHVNRSQSKINTEVLEAALKARRFYPDISVTFVDADGLYWDCMHRLMAIIKTGVPAWILVVRGVREEAAECIDTGRARTYKDWLRMQGVSWYAQRGTLARALAIYAKHGMEGTRNPSQAAVANFEMDAWLHRPGVDDSLKLADSMRGVLRKANAGILAYMIMVTGAGQDPTGFWKSVRDGENVTKGMPAKTLREFLLAGGPRNAIIKADPRLIQLYACTTAWNKHVRGEEYLIVRPVYAERVNGTKYFPARNIPDVLPLGFDAQAELARFAETFGALRGASRGQQLTLGNGSDSE